MKILVLSQVYWPDTASTAQHLHDLTKNLSKKGHSIDVISSIRQYENPNNKFQKFEIHNGINISRINNSGLGKENVFFRLIDFLSFNILISFRLLMLIFSKYDCVIGMTSPPLLSYIGVLYAKLTKSKFVYWTMDLQPELSIVAKYIKKNSFLANILQKRGDYIFKNSKLIIALDKYMKRHILKRVKNIKGRIKVIPVWPVIDEIYEDHRLKNPFRISNNFEDKIVVMYSGNHSVMHPLNTLLSCAKELKDDNRLLFVHIGGGVRIKEVKKFKDKNNLKNIIILPYQPREKIHLSLGSSDIQVVSLGNGCVGYTHPNKIYGAMYIGKPILYLGPQNSHITDILNKIEGNILVEHDDVLKLKNSLTNFADKNYKNHEIKLDENKYFALKNFSPEILINKTIEELEKLA